MSKRLESGVVQAPGGVLLCAVEGCAWITPPGECLCVNHCRTRDARTEVMREIAVNAGFLTEGLSFGDALVQLKSGRRVARRSGWNGKGMWIALQTPDANSKMGLPYLYMSTVEGKLVPWLASQTDILAEDWSVIS